MYFDEDKVNGVNARNEMEKIQKGYISHKKAYKLDKKKSIKWIMRYFTIIIIILLNCLSIIS